MSRTRRLGHPCRMSRYQLCAVHVSTGMLMCRPHWYMVPAALRARINELWGASGGDIMKLTTEYFDVVREAAEAVKTHLELAS